MARPLRVWLVQTGEELPVDPGPPRLLRTALLARELVKRGHEVTFWNASFNHQQKLQRTDTSRFETIPDGYRVCYLHGRAYSSHVSLTRIRSHQDNAAEFARLAPKEPQPDVILSGLPTLELCDAVASYAKPRGVPFAIDCRDMWPDVIADHLPGLVRLGAWPVLAYWRHLRYRALSKATGVTGVTDRFVEWGLAAAGRQRRPLDRAFHLAIPAELPPEHEMRAADAFWLERLGPPDPATVTACFAGTLSRRLDIPAFVKGATEVGSETARRLKVVICGKGDLENEVKAQITGHPHVVFAGWRSAAELRSLMLRSDFGVLPYRNTDDFLNHFVNKMGEYMSAGLPVMTGLDGLMGELLASRDLGIRYDVGDASSVARALRGAVDGVAPLRGKKSAAIATYRELFDPTRIYPGFADYLEELAASANLRPAQPLR